MKKIFLFFCVVANLMVACKKELPDIGTIETGSSQSMPGEWIDKDTGHKVIRLTPRLGDNLSFYFHNNPFLPAGDGANEKMIFHGKTNQGMQLFSVDLITKKIDQITNKRGIISSGLSAEMVGKKSSRVYYQCNDSVFATNVENHQTELLYVFPDSIRGEVTTINADETLLGGIFLSSEDAETLDRIKEEYDNTADELVAIEDAKLLYSLFTLQITTGEFKKIHNENHLLFHIQFSPIDPEFLMFCHEGFWSKVDRIWTINVNEGLPRLMHKRTMENEIAGHEFFSPDGKWIWFDLQVPQGETFYLSGVNVLTNETERYKLTRNEWSIHYTISPDQQLFAGDGGDPGQVANAGDGMWIYLFRPAGDHLSSERLVNMKHHNYKLEPNVHFSPDGKWVIFRANFGGQSDIYAVEVDK
ncbi:MAG: oligogalacturonate lyase family protein [Prolixibacteraceae bacterium]|nr:oligogalacturonate lyase family protein [Prolixibacteraceae bacterium]